MHGLLHDFRRKRRLDRPKCGRCWKILVDFTEATKSHTITTLANCGRFATASDTSATQVIIEGAGDDQDGDGVQDANDRCPTGIGADDGWQSTMATDGDQDG